MVVKRVVPDTATLERLETLKQTVETSANNTQNSLSGLVNASVSKLAERVVGLEAKVDKVVGLEAKIDKVVGLETHIEKLQTTLTLEAEMNNRIDRLEAQIRADLNVAAQASIEIGKKVESRLENIQATAGRDVNMLPQAAVDVIIQTAQVFSGVIATLCGLASTVVVVMARNSRKRAEQRSKLEHEERERLYQLLQRVTELKP